MKILDSQYDDRSECLSLLASMTLAEYKKIARYSFEVGGNLAGQRDVIKNSSAASKIRKRMNEDFTAGAIFPAVVLGIKTTSKDVIRIKTNSNIFNVSNYASKDISIIDGMQRSNIYFSNYEGCEDREIRVEFWISDKIVKLLYRMLVLNTGQVPWNTRRQVEVIFSSLSETIINSLNERNPCLADKVDIMSVDDGKRRTQAGKYHKSTMIQLFLGFNTRKVKVDVNDQLADEYQRFDMMDSIDKDINFDLFIAAFSYMCELDFAFSACEDQSTRGQFVEGKSIFGSIPACLGFIVSCAEYVMGKIPVERTEEEKIRRDKALNDQINKIVNILSRNRTNNFLALDSLNDVINQLPKGRIGDEMRNLFKIIFIELLRYSDLDEIPTMESFWRN